MSLRSSFPFFGRTSASGSAHLGPVLCWGQLPKGAHTHTQPQKHLRSDAWISPALIANNNLLRNDGVRKQVDKWIINSCGTFSVLWFVFSLKSRLSWGGWEGKNNINIYFDSQINKLIKLHYADLIVPYHSNRVRHSRTAGLLVVL